jgi:hypothetical protein
VNRFQIWVRAWLAALAVGLVAMSGPARASGDSGCYPTWKPVSFSSGCANHAALAPSNDTRANLLLLTLRPGTPAHPYPKFEWEERALGRTFFTWNQLTQVYGPAPNTNGSGSRCDSLTAGAADFHAALVANRQVSAAERDVLEKARGGLAAECNGNARALQAAWPTGLGSAAARAFLGYLQAADAFYAGDWAAARTGFAALPKARDPWVAEAATYMVIRVELNAAQEKAFDDYGTFAGPAKVDQAAASRGQAAIAAYLKRFPKGRYAGSTKGLERRASWLAGDLAGLSRAYDRLLGAVPSGSDQAIALVQEVDNKLLFAKDAGAAMQSPVLLAAYDLMQMRSSEGTDTPRFSAADLAAQQPRFAARPDIYAYLLAAQAFYVERDAARTLALTATRAKGTGPAPLGYSAAVLRGLALADRRDPAEAAFWQSTLDTAQAPYQRPLVELALAINYERAGKLDAIFALHSPIADPTIREILLRNVAAPALLRRVSSDTALDKHQREVALFSLLDGDLGHGHFADFGRDRVLIPSDAGTDGFMGAFPLSDKIPVGLFASGTWSDVYPCPALDQTAARLAINPGDPTARLCLGDFWRINGFDRLGSANYSEPASKDGGPALGSSPSQFTGAAITRASLYPPIIADARAPAPERAYALFRSVMCYAPSGINDCGGTDLPKAQRKAWYEMLKHDYPDSRWARDLRYYW